MAGIRRFCLGCLLLLALPLAALIPPGSASANALAGLTLLSASVADLQLSPALPLTGIAASLQLPYADPAGASHSLQAAQRLQYLILSAGITHTGNPDYNAQDLRLGLGLNWAGFSAGYSQHLLRESSGSQAISSWCGDAALAWRGCNYGCEARLMRLGREDTELHLSASTGIVTGVQAAASYVHTPAGPDGYRVATSIGIGANFTLQSSWQSSPHRFGAGLRFQLKAWNLMYAVRTHPDLRLSHSLDLGYQW